MLENIAWKVSRKKGEREGGKEECEREGKEEGLEKERRGEWDGIGEMSVKESYMIGEYRMWWRGDTFKPILEGKQ